MLIIFWMKVKVLQIAKRKRERERVRERVREHVVNCTDEVY